jgi:aspartate 1-decarboxylase
MRRMCKSKIHRATVTEANLGYEGSITIDRNLLEAADILPYEMVQVYNVNNGERFETYAISGEKGSGVVCLNGPAARLGMVGDKVIIVSTTQMDDREASAFVPRFVFVNEKNQQVTQPASQTPRKTGAHKKK